MPPYSAKLINRSTGLKFSSDSKVTIRLFSYPCDIIDTEGDKSKTNPKFERRIVGIMDSRDEKKERFMEGKTNKFKIKPSHIAVMVTVLVVVAVSAVYFTSDSEDSASTADTDSAFTEPFYIGSEPVNEETQAGNNSNGSASETSASTSIIPASSIAQFDIKGMTCGGCASGISRGLGDAVGVLQCEISYRDKGGMVQYDPGLTNPQEIADYISGMGFATKVAN